MEGRRREALLREALLDLAVRADDDDGPYAEEREDRDLLHERVEERRAVEHVRGDVDHHRLALVHLDVRRAGAEEVHEGPRRPRLRGAVGRVVQVGGFRSYGLRVDLAQRLTHRRQRQRQDLVNDPGILRLCRFHGRLALIVQGCREALCGALLRVVRPGRDGWS